MKTRTIFKEAVAGQRYIFCLLMLGITLCNALQPVYGQVDRYKGQRPYELDWAGRYDDDHEPFIDFETDEAWTVKAKDGLATIGRSNEEIIWGDYCYKLTFKANSTKSTFVVRPPKPLKITQPFTAMNFWVFGNYRIWNDHARGRSIAELSMLFETSSGEALEIPFRRKVDFGRWYLMHMRFTKEQRNAFLNGAVLTGIKLTNCEPDVEEALYFDNLSFFVEDLTTPLKYDVLPRPGVDLAVVHDGGGKTGKDRL